MREFGLRLTSHNASGSPEATTQSAVIRFHPGVEAASGWQYAAGAAVSQYAY